MWFIFFGRFGILLFARETHAASSTFLYWICNFGPFRHDDGLDRGHTVRGRWRLCGRPYSSPNTRLHHIFNCGCQAMASQAYSIPCHLHSDEEIMALTRQGTVVTERDRQLSRNVNHIDRWPARSLC